MQGGGGQEILPHCNGIEVTSDDDMTWPWQLHHDLVQSSWIFQLFLATSETLLSSREPGSSEITCLPWLHVLRKY